MVLVILPTQDVSVRFHWQMDTNILSGMVKLKVTMSNAGDLIATLTFHTGHLIMKQSPQLLSQAKIYLQHNPGDANLLIEELRQMVGSVSASQLMKWLQRYTAKVQESNQYWFQHHQKLQALLEQKGQPTYFWTVSSADKYWPKLHSLMPHASSNPTHAMCVQAVISNLHITGWYITSKILYTSGCTMH